MGKTGKNRKQKISGSKTKKILVWNAAAITAVIVIVFLSGNINLPGFVHEKGKSFHVKGGETRPVLSPALFTGKALAAYSAAKKYPEVLDQVYCYCHCDNPPFNHKSLLSCFTDRHGAT